MNTVYTDPESKWKYKVYDNLQHPGNKDIPRGQCLFVAFADQLSRLTTRATRPIDHLRQLAIAHQRGILNDPKRYVEGVHRDKRQLDLMEKPTTYGGDHEIAALAYACRVQVRLLLLRPDREAKWIDFKLEGPWVCRAAVTTYPTIRLGLFYHPSPKGRSPRNHCGRTTVSMYCWRRNHTSLNLKESKK